VKFYMIMRFFYISKITYLLRNVPRDEEAEWWQNLMNLNELILKTAVPFQLDSNQLMHAHLPTKLGGISCRNLDQVSCEAYLARFSGINAQDKRFDLACRSLY